MRLFTAHGLSESLTSQKQGFILSFSVVDLLVTVSVYQSEVAIGVLSALVLRYEMVSVDGFAVKEGSSTPPTSAALPVCHPLQTRRQVFSLGLFPGCPVGSQTRVIRRRASFDQDVPPDGMPTELQQ